MIVLVHGLGVGPRYFEPLARELRGAGEVRRPALRDVAPIEELAERLADRLDAPALIVGHSMGCQLAAEVAARRPGAVAALVLVGPTVDPRGRSVWRYAARFAVDAVREPPSLVGLVLRDYATFGPWRFLRQARHTLAHRLEDTLPRVACPTVVVRGARDPLCPARWGREAARLARGRLVEIPGAGHAVQYSHPREVADVVRALAAGTPAAAG